MPQLIVVLPHLERAVHWPPERMMATQYLYEMNGGQCYGYFSGKYLYTMDGTCTHYRAGSDNRYLFAMEGGECEFYQSGKYFYEMGGSCRWWLHPYD